jgi:hypothetical protein
MRKLKLKFYEISQYHSKNKEIIINQKKQLEKIYFFSKTNIIKLKRVGFSKNTLILTTTILT